MPPGDSHCGQPGGDHLLEPFAKLDNRDPFQDLAGEGKGQELARFVASDAARTQIEDRFFIEPTDGGTVGAANVVGEDLELRIRVDDRVVGEQEIAVGLLGVGLLRVLVDDDPAVEDRLRATRRGCPCRAGGCCSWATRGAP